MKLKEFLDKYGTNTTSNFQLLHWGKQLKLKNFCVVMKDEIKAIEDKKGSPRAAEEYTAPRDHSGASTNNELNLFCCPVIYIMAAMEPRGEQDTIVPSAPPPYE